RPPELGPAFRLPLAHREPRPVFRTMLPSWNSLQLLFVQVQWTRSHRRLSDFNEVPVGVSHVAPQFRCVDFWTSDEFRATRRPKLVVAPDVTHVKVEKDAKNVGVPRRRSHNFRFVVGRTATTVDGEPNMILKS